jgi:hypothetical protein
MSSFRKVGASDGGAAIRPWNVVRPKGTPRAAVQDADQDGSWNAACGEASNEQEPDAGEKGGSGAEIAEGDE